MTASTFEQIYQMVRHIPPGQVATYGQIARLLGMAHSARTVGWALRALPEGSNVPWQRVVNAQGTISLDPYGAAVQKALLESEGVFFDEQGRIDLDIYGWPGLDLGEQQELLGPKHKA
jgi:methylated-DNA-protein-cysteine methyltransferase-like protein